MSVPLFFLIFGGCIAAFWTSVIRGEPVGVLLSIVAFACLLAGTWLEETRD